MNTLIPLAGTSHKRIAANVCAFPRRVSSFSQSSKPNLTMIMQVYRVFGRGPSTLRIWIDPTMTVAEYIQRLKFLQVLAVDDGNDGITGTRSVADDIALSKGIETSIIHDPSTTHITNPYSPRFPILVYQFAIVDRPFVRDMLLREADLFLSALKVAQA